MLAKRQGDWCIVEWPLRHYREQSLSFVLALCPFCVPTRLHKSMEQWEGGETPFMSLAGIWSFSRQPVITARSPVVPRLHFEAHPRNIITDMAFLAFPVGQSNQCGRGYDRSSSL